MGIWTPCMAKYVAIIKAIHLLHLYYSYVHKMYHKILNENVYKLFSTWPSFNSIMEFDHCNCIPFNVAHCIGKYIIYPAFTKRPVSHSLQLNLTIHVLFLVAWSKANWHHSQSASLPASKTYIRERTSFFTQWSTHTRARRTYIASILTLHAMFFFYSSSLPN